MNRLLLLAIFAWPAVVAAPARPAPGAPADLSGAGSNSRRRSAACHGADGGQPAAANPNIAGQHADYITQQLRTTRPASGKPDHAGHRRRHVTRPCALAARTTRSRSRGSRGARRRARQVRRGAVARRRCRDRLPRMRRVDSPTGAGIPKNYPRIAGQYADYTYAQLKAFKAGQRGMDKDGDANGRHARDREGDGRRAGAPPVFDVPLASIIPMTRQGPRRMTGRRRCTFSSGVCGGRRWAVVVGRDEIHSTTSVVRALVAGRSLCAPRLLRSTSIRSRAVAGSPPART